MKQTTLLIGLAIVIIFLLIGAELYFSYADFGQDNPFWNGMGSLSSDINAQPLYSDSSLSSLGSHNTLLIMSPTVNYTAEESNEVLSFLDRGGKVVVMDDFERSDSLLSAIGSPVLVDPIPMCQYDNYYVNQSCPIITNFSQSAYFDNVSSIVMNYPAILNVSGGNVLATTSDMAWLDYSDDSQMDNNVSVSTYPVIAAVNYNGAGQLIVISDPDIFINGMLDKGNNQAFMSNLLSGAVWVDVSHGRGITPLGVFYFLVRGQVLVQLLLALFVLACGLAFVERKTIMGFLNRKNR
jgi:hypothetical protein